MPPRALSLIFCVLSAAALGPLACLPSYGSDDELGGADPEQTETGDGAGAGALGCDPLAQDCDGGMGCYVGGGDTLFECQITISDLSEGEACEQANHCAVGLYCAPQDLLPSCAGVGCCAAYCDLGDASPCPGGTACVSFFSDAAPPMLDHVGVCALAG